MAKTVISAGAGASLAAIVMMTVVPHIQTFEGTKFTAYKDIAGVLTVCSGHTGTDVVVNKIYTSSQCANLTQSDAEKAASGVLKVSPHLLYHPMQLASAVSFSYNVGVGTYGKSSVAAEFNQGNFTAACNDLLKYTLVAGKPSIGLENRRKQEQIMCLSTLTPNQIQQEK